MMKQKEQHLLSYKTWEKTQDMILQHSGITSFIGISEKNE